MTIAGVLEYPLIMVFPVAMAFAAANDLLTMTISNRVSLILIAAFLAVALISGISWQEFLMHLGAGSVMLLAGIFVFSMGWLGGGDAKLLAAASLWIGFGQLLPFLAYVGILGGVLAVAILAYRNTPFGALPLPGWAARLHADGNGIPYGVAIAAAALLIYPSTNWFAALAN